MQKLLALAQQAADKGEIPVAAALYETKTGKLVAQDHNRTREADSPLAHAEFLVLQKACATLEVPYLMDYTLYVTLEPCAFCASALALVHVGALIFGAYNAKGGAVTHGPQLFDHHSEWKPHTLGGICEKEAAQLLQDFFSKIREK